MSYENRIVGYGEEAPDQLLANPKNWRIHPKHQQDALKGVLGEVGYVQAVMVNKRTGNLVDGHMRVMVSLRENVEKIPVVYVDLSQEEEDIVLATLDPIAALAAVDAEKQKELLNGIVAESPEVTSFIDSLLSGSTPAAGFLDKVISDSAKDDDGEPLVPRADATNDTATSFQTTMEEREIVLRALTRIRDNHDLGTVTRALVWLCQHFEGDDKNPSKNTK